MRVELCDRDQCTGCMACKQSCKHGAITIEVSDKGFAFPVVNQDKCVCCNLCVKACPVLNLKPPYHYNSESRCYAVYSKQKKVRKSSSSGGVFYTLAKNVISQGGVVFGAAWTEGIYLKHIEAEDEESLMQLLRSKYVQSDTREVYSQVKQRLDSGRLVLFCGTPCQVAAIKSFLHGKEYDNLILVDVICQGVPSPGLFRKYLKELETEYHTKIVDVIFRSKKYGWRSGLLLLIIKCEDGRIINVKYKNNSYYRAFLKNYFLRESCYDCKFKASGKGCFSDLTLADFWRIGTKIPYECKSYQEGISAVLTNTPKGISVFEDIKEYVHWTERTYEEFSTNGGLRTAVQPLDLNEAYETASKNSFDIIQSKHYPYSFRNYVSDWINIHFSQNTINKIKKWIKK